MFYLALYMDSRIVRLKKYRKHTLSQLMIVALVEAAVKQNQGIPFGPADIKGGSFAPLIKKGLVVHKNVTIQNNVESLWQVTPEAINLLKAMGVDVVY